VGTYRRLWYISLSKRQVVELLIQTIEVTRGLLPLVPTIFVPMISSAMHAGIRRRPSLFAFVILAGIISLVIIIALLLLLLLVAVPMLVALFTTVLLLMVGHAA